MRSALIVTALASLALGMAPPALASDDWTALHRSLQLRMLNAGARCPVTDSRSVDHGRFSGAGSGPVYALLPSLFEADGRHAGWIGSKTLWIWPTRLLQHGIHVLVRGRRLDHAGVMRFQLGPNWDSPLRSELHIDTSQPVGSFSGTTWGATVTMLFGRTHGCYGLQLDARHGTSTIVVAT